MFVLWYPWLEEVTSPKAGNLFNLVIKDSSGDKSKSDVVGQSYICKYLQWPCINYVMPFFDPPAPMFVTNDTTYHDPLRNYVTPLSII